MSNRLDHDDVLSDERVTWLLEAAAAPTEPGPLPGEDEALAAFRVASRHRTRRGSVLSRLTPARTAVAVTIGAGAFLAAGVGAAAANALPGAAQETAQTWLSNLGIEVPGPDAHSAGHTDTRDGSDEATPENGTEDSTEDSTAAEDGTDEGTEGATLPDASAHGQEVSGIAKDKTLTGADKGAAVSATASGGKSKAGAHKPGRDRSGATSTSKTPGHAPDGAGGGTGGR